MFKSVQYDLLFVPFPQKSKMNLTKDDFQKWNFRIKVSGIRF